MLPLRVVVQVFFFEKVRASIEGGHVAEIQSNIKVLLEGRPTPSKAKPPFSSLPPEDKWSASRINSPKSSISILKMRLGEDHDVESDRVVKPSKMKSLSMMPSRSKRMFSKLWHISTSASEKN